MVLLQKMEILNISAVISQHIKLYLHTALDCDVECLILMLFAGSSFIFVVIKRLGIKTIFQFLKWP